MTRYCWRCAAPLPGVPPVTCAQCGQEHYANPKAAADAIVVRDEAILLVQRAVDPWRGHWDIPGGFIEPGEEPARTAERELLEETGIVGAVERLVGVWTDTYGEPEPDGLQPTTLNIVYIVRVLADAGAAPAEGETTALRWFELDALPDAIAFPVHAVPALEAARRMLRGA